MGKADVFTGMSLTEKLIWLKKFGKGGGSTPTYEDRTATGNPVIFTTNFAQNAKALSVDFAPKQSLNGFDHPWPGGSGKNLIGAELITYGKSIDGSGNVVDYGTNRGSTVNGIKIDNTKSYVFSAKTSDVRLIYAVFNGSTLVRRISGVVSGTAINVSGGDTIFLCLYPQDSSRPAGDRLDYRKVLPDIDEVQFEQNSTSTSYEPYSNICPITGVDSIDVVANSNTHEFDLGRTAYGGTLNAKTGVLTITDAEIASYNGEALPSTWISDRDEYKAGTTPTIGAQVVYKLATPQNYQLTAQEIALLEGENVIATDGDSLNVTYQVKV